MNGAISRSPLRCSTIGLPSDPDQRFLSYRSCHVIAASANAKPLLVGSKVEADPVSVGAHHVMRRGQDMGGRQLFAYDQGVKSIAASSSLRQSASTEKGSYREAKAIVRVAKPSSSLSLMRAVSQAGFVSWWKAFA